MYKVEAATMTEALALLVQQYVAQNRSDAPTPQAPVVMGCFSDDHEAMLEIKVLSPPACFGKYEVKDECTRLGTPCYFMSRCKEAFVSSKKLARKKRAPQ